MNGQAMDQNMDMSALAKLFAQQQPQPAQPSTGAVLGAAGIQAGTSLLGGLLAQRAQEQMQAQAIKAQAAQQQTASEAESLVKAQQQQQDALSRLMASYRSALIK